MKKILLFLIGIFAFILWFYYIDPRETWQGIKKVDLSYLSLGYAFFFISHFLKILRWGLILEKIRKVPLFIVSKYYWASIFINTFMPLRVGELSKSLFLKKDYNIDISASMSSIVVDRFYGFVVRLVVICFIPFLTIDLYTYLRQYLIYVAVLSVIILVLLGISFKKHNLFLKIIDNTFFFLPHSWKQHVLSFIEKSIITIRKIHFKKKDVFLFMLLSLLGLIAQAYVAYYFFRAVNINLPIGIFIISTTIMDFLVILPSPPAGIGTTEWYTNIVYTLGLGIPKNPVASITLVAHGISLCIYGFLGCISLTAIGQGIFRKDTWVCQKPATQEKDIACSV